METKTYKGIYVNIGSSDNPDQSSFIYDGKFYCYKSFFSAKREITKLIETKTVRIKSCRLGTYWYYTSIGEVFKVRKHRKFKDKYFVVSYDGKNENTLTRMMGHGKRKYMGNNLISITDCEEVN